MSGSASMRRYPRTQPLAAQRKIAREALEEAAQRGLALPPRIHVEWFAPPRALGSSRGEVEHRDGRSTLLLNTNVLPGELREIVLHELRHVSDHLADPQCRRWNAEVREQRANNFVAKCNVVRR